MSRAEVAVYIDALNAEASEGGNGSAWTIARLSEALVVRAGTADEPGWLKGLTDPQVARALAAIHDRLERSWRFA
jgi:hypothetical protein